MQNGPNWVLFNIASLYWRIIGDPASAIECLRRAVHFAPTRARDVGYIGLANVLHRQGFLNEAVIVARAALDTSGNSVSAWSLFLPYSHTHAYTHTHTHAHTHAHTLHIHAHTHVHTHHNTHTHAHTHTHVHTHTHAHTHTHTYHRNSPLFRSMTKSERCSWIPSPCTIVLGDIIEYSELHIADISIY